jgi:hypothetical protein
LGFVLITGAAFGSTLDLASTFSLAGDLGDAAGLGSTFGVEFTLAETVLGVGTTTAGFFDFDLTEDTVGAAATGTLT